MFLSVITAPIVLAQLIGFLIRRCHVKLIVILQIRSATPIQDMNMSPPIYWRWHILSATTKNVQRFAFSSRQCLFIKLCKRKRKYWVLQRNDMFKFKITLHRHDARQNLNYYILLDPPLFSLPSTFKLPTLVCGEKLGLVWRNRKKISQIINDYLYLPFFLLFISWCRPTFFTFAFPLSYSFLSQCSRYGLPVLWLARVKEWRQITEQTSLWFLWKEVTDRWQVISWYIY